MLSKHAFIKYSKNSGIGELYYLKQLFFFYIVFIKCK